MVSEVREEHSSASATKSSSHDWIGAEESSSSKKTTYQNLAKTSALSGANVSVTSSQGNVTLLGSQLTARDKDGASGKIELSAKNGTVNLLTVKEIDFSSLEKKSDSLMWQSNAGSGHNTETTNTVKMTGEVNIEAKHIVAQISSKDKLNELAKQSGMGWIGELQNNPKYADKIEWSKIDEASKNWDYSQEGLSPKGAAIISIAVAAATSGMGAGLVGVTNAVGAAAINAGFSSLVAQASVSLINNGGNLEATFKQLGKEESIKATLAAMATASVGAATAGTGAGAVGTQATVGCATGEMTGVGCERAAVTAAVISTTSEIYRAATGYAADARPGDNRNGSSTGNSTYEPDSKTGQQLPVDRGMNVVGDNDTSHTCSQGTACSKALNTVPFINATAGFHDWLFNGETPVLRHTDWNNIWTMPASALIAIPATMNDPSLSWLVNSSQTYKIEPPPPSEIPSTVKLNSTNDQLNTMKEMSR